MRYLFFTYHRKASGKIDEVMVLSNRIKTKDWQMVNVILDFKEQKVLKSYVNDTAGSKDWDTVVSYYYKHYAHTIERLFEENGHPLSVVADTPEKQQVDQKDIS